MPERVAPTPQEADDHLARRLAVADQLAEKLGDAVFRLAAADKLAEAVRAWYAGFDDEDFDEFDLAEVEQNIIDALREYEATR